MAKDTVEVTVIDDSTIAKCEAACGVNWSLPESIALARQGIKERFGGKVALNYLDLTKTTASQGVTQWQELIKKEKLALPLLLIGGKTRISGEFDIRQLLDVIEAEMEMEAR